MLKDIYNRYFSYLRLSITDLCNFKCKYCLPENVNLKKKHYLSVKEIYNLVSAFVDLGINKIRLTGGEPTVRKDFFEIGKIIAKFSKIRSLVFTTNGYKLNRIVNTLCSIGFTGINVSLDTLSKKKFYIITKRDYFNNVFEGVLLALESKLLVKINIVLSNLFSVKDFENFYSILKYKSLTIRFIDQMETGLIKKTNSKLICSDFLIKFLKFEGWYFSGEKMFFDGPALLFKNKNFLGSIGIINPYSHEFCSGCNRLRVSSIGELYLCLFGGKAYNLRNFLNCDKKKTSLKKFLMDKIKLKPHSHFIKKKIFGKIGTLSSIGG